MRRRRLVPALFFFQQWFFFSHLWAKRPHPDGRNQSRSESSETRKTGSETPPPHQRHFVSGNDFCPLRSQFAYALIDRAIQTQSAS
jgi:hypothetical protein